MPQELKGWLTVLCPACRVRGPALIGKALEWHCPHRKTTVRETNARRFVTLGKDSVALPHQEDPNNGSHVTII